MSYENVPKNLTEQGVLVRGARPDYFKLEADAFPAPTADESGAVLQVTDTGHRYVWTKTQWVQTHYFGLAILVEQSDRGGLSHPVTLQDQTTDMLDLIFLEEKFTGLTLASDTTVDDRFFTLTAGHGLTNANSMHHFLEMADITGRFVQSEILDVTGDVVTLRMPIGRIFEPANTLINTGNPNMAIDAATGAAVDGSVTPVIFKVRPSPFQIGDITRIVFTSTSDNPSDYSTFGGAPALDIGITLRKKRADATYKNHYTYVVNRDLVSHGFDNTPDEPKATGNATYGRAGRITFASQGKHGVAERLSGALGEELQIIISELMINGTTGNSEVRFMAQGSELQGD